MFFKKTVRRTLEWEHPGRFSCPQTELDNARNHDCLQLLHFDILTEESKPMVRGELHPEYKQIKINLISGASVP